MTVEPPPEARTRTDLENVHDQITDLAVLDVIIGSGLMAGGFAAALFGLLPSVTYAGRMAAFWFVIASGEVCLLIATAGFLWRDWRGWNAARARSVVGLGAAALALFVLQLGILGIGKIVAPVVCLCAGSPFFAAGIGLWRRRRWGRTLQVAITAAASAGLGYLTVLAATEPALAIFSGVMVLGLPVLLLPFLDPLCGFLSPSASALEQFARWRAVSRAAFAVALHGVVLVAIFLAVIVPPNLLNSFQRSKQKRTLSELRSIATALESYSIDHGSYPSAHDMAELEKALTPDYIVTMPRSDAWGWPFDYHRVQLATGAQGFVIRSAGADGAFEQTDPTAYPGGPIDSFERDLVFSTVSPPQYPEGMMAP